MNRREFVSSGVGAFAAVRSPAFWIAARLDGSVEHAEWPSLNRAVSVGSLLKPFLAAAYLRSGKQAPVVECLGAASGCWKPGGHGRLDLVRALAYSCNVYFLSLARTMDRAALDSTCLSYGLGLPGREWDASRLIGLGPGWPQTPVVVVQAFARLAHDGTETTVRPVLAGMALCARAGTAQAAGFACYAKTGTAECSHTRGGEGDGYAVAVFPLEQPRHALLVMAHNTTGANAAGALRAVGMRLGE